MARTKFLILGSGRGHSKISMTLNMKRVFSKVKICATLSSKRLVSKMKLSDCCQKNTKDNNYTISAEIDNFVSKNDTKETHIDKHTDCEKLQRLICSMPCIEQISHQLLTLKPNAMKNVLSNYCVSWGDSIKEHIMESFGKNITEDNSEFSITFSASELDSGEKNPTVSDLVNSTEQLQL